MFGLLVFLVTMEMSTWLQFCVITENKVSTLPPSPPPALFITITIVIISGGLHEQTWQQETQLNIWLSMEYQSASPNEEVWKRNMAGPFFSRKRLDLLLNTTTLLLLLLAQAQCRNPQSTPTRTFPSLLSLFPFSSLLFSLSPLAIIWSSSLSVSWFTFRLPSLHPPFSPFLLGL